MGRDEHDIIFGIAHGHDDGKDFLNVLRMFLFIWIVQTVNQVTSADNVISLAQNIYHRREDVVKTHRAGMTLSFLE